MARSPSSPSPPASDRAGHKARASSKPFTPSPSSPANTAASSKSTSLKAAAPANAPAASCPPMWSPPATSLTPRSSNTSAPKIITAIPARSSFPPIDRPAAHSDRPRPPFPLGGNSTENPGRAEAEDDRKCPRRPHRLGQIRGRGERLYRQPPRAMPPSRRPLVRDSQPPPERHARTTHRPAPQSQAPHAPQHRH